MSQDVGNPQAAHSLLRRYAPAFLAKGGEHLVYAIPGRDVVVKIEIRSLVELAAQAQRDGCSLVSPPRARTAKLLRSYLRCCERRYDMLRRYFGREAVPGMMQTLMPVPMTMHIAAALGKADCRSDAAEAWAIVRVQRRVAGVGACPTLATDIPERDAFGPDGRILVDCGDHARVMRVLVEGEGDLSLKRRAFTSGMGPEMDMVLDAADVDSAFAAALADFTRRAIRYAEGAQGILDLVGPNNVVFIRTEGGWRYRLIDVLFGGDAAELASAAGSMEAAVRGESLSQEALIVLCNAVCFTRTINGLARYLDMPDRLSWVPDVAKGKVDYLAILAPLFVATS